MTRPHALRVRARLAALVVLLALGCAGGSEEEVDGGLAPPDAAPSVDAAREDGAPGPDAAPPLADAGPAEDAGRPTPPRPDAEDMEVRPMLRLPAGDVILYNDWSLPNRLLAVRPDGTTLGTVLEARRVWTFGATDDGARIAFAGAPAGTEEAWGLNAVSDAIQYAWLHDTATQTTSLLTFGNLNEDCLRWSADGETLWSCRRTGFEREEAGLRFGSYRVVAVDGETGEATGLTDPERTCLEPVPLPDGGVMYACFRPEPVGYDVYRRNVEGEETLFRANARYAVVDPAGERVAFVDGADGRVHLVGLDGEGDRVIGPLGALSLDWSPDGDALVFVRRGAMGCNRIMTVRADGTQADAPTTVVECMPGGTFPTRTQWVRVPGEAE